MAVLSLYVLFKPAGGGPTFFEDSDKVVHLLLFALLAGTARWRFGPAKAALAAVAAYAVVSELVQGALLSSRSGDPYDVLADLVGVAIGWVGAARLLDRESSVGDA